MFKLPQCVPIKSYVTFDLLDYFDNSLLGKKKRA